MAILADILLGAGAIGAAIYCIVLSKRLRRFNNLQTGMGGAVAVLSAQVDDMTQTLNSARDAAQESASTLTDLTERAERAASKLEIMMASLHDLPDETCEAPVRDSHPAEPNPHPVEIAAEQTSHRIMFKHHGDGRTQ